MTQGVIWRQEIKAEYPTKLPFGLLRFYENRRDEKKERTWNVILSRAFSEGGTRWNDLEFVPFQESCVFLCPPFFFPSQNCVHAAIFIVCVRNKVRLRSRQGPSKKVGSILFWQLANRMFHNFIFIN